MYTLLKGMKLGSLKRTVILFSVLLGISIAFIVASIWLISSVNDDRQEVERLVNQISILSTLEENSLNCISNLDQNKKASFHENLEAITSTDFNSENNPELIEISELSVGLKSFYLSSGEEKDFRKIKLSLEKIIDLSVALKKDQWQSFGIISESLGRKWNYAHILIVAACFLSLIMALVGFGIYQSRRKLNALKERNSLFMTSLTDCVIICDNTGRILEYNKAMSDMFGYGIKEAIGMNVRELYVLESEFHAVERRMSRGNSFKGEVINKRKDGEHFISYLSSNTVFNDEGVGVGTMGISRDISNEKQNQEQFQHIINNATDIIYTTNVEGDITYVNTSAVNVLGYSVEQFYSMSFRDLIPPDYLKMVEKFYNDQFRNQQSDSYLECKMIKANGEEIWIGQNVRTSFSPTDPNRIVGFFGILRNLDQNKKVEIELQESEAKYRELFDNSKDLIQSIDANGGFLYVNEAWKQTLGYNDEEVNTLNLFDILHSDSRDYCEELLTDILKLGELDDSEEHEHFFKMLTKSSEEVILKGTISVRYQNGQVQSLQTFLRDVTEHHAVELALKRSEENFQLIGNSLNDVVFLYNVSNARYEFISPKCEDVLGAKPEFFFAGGNYAETYVHPEDRPLLIAMNERVLKGQKSHVEYRRKTEDQELKWVDEKWFPIKDEYGKVVSISGICRDITDMKAAYDTIFEQNREISQSILYAKNIQLSTLPTAEEVKAILPESFVFYRAKDTLSGDLYIVDEVMHTDGRKWPAVVVGDCTGHGVPGGLLSLLCSGLLTESLTSPRINSPSEALDFVREKLIRLFRSNPSKYILDGMDAAFCVMDFADNKMYFAGANLACYLVREAEVIEIRGDKQPIGYSSSMAPFVNFTIEIEKGDCVYLTTDGYFDQFGGENNKKFLRKRFTNLLIQISPLSMEDQRMKIEENFLNWIGAGEQTDDIALLGWRI